MFIALIFLPTYLGSLNVLVLANHILQVSWDSADDAGQSAISYTVNATGTDIEHNYSASVKHPITSVSITGIPQYSTGTVSVWAKNLGALSKPVTSRFRMVNIVTNGRYVHTCSHSTSINACSSECIVYDKG